MIKNSILLCTYNEGKYIKDTITSLYNFIPDLEIIIVDDSSSDETFSIINNLKKKYNLKIISRSQSKGLGSAFQRALIDSQGENVGWIDTNMGELAKMFPNMISELKNYDLILLSRYVKGGSDKRIFLRVFCSKLINVFCRLILSNKIKDYTSSIFIMKRKILNETSILGYGHGDFFIEFLFSVIKKGFTIKEIPYEQKKDDDDGNTNITQFIAFLYIRFFLFFKSDNYKI